MKKAKIIVLAGQSNAVGVGQVRFLKNHFTEERIQKWYDGYPNVQMNYFSHDKKSGGFVDTTVGCTEVAHYSGVTMGPELGIAEVVTERYPGETIYIVKCAFGGMSLYKDWRSPSCGDPYDPEAYADQKENIIFQEMVRFSSQGTLAVLPTPQARKDVLMYLTMLLSHHLARCA